jgi:hypothetical protein
VDPFSSRISSFASARQPPKYERFVVDLKGVAEKLREIG